ncbi:phosphopantetheine-binding protein [Spirillospora sp. NPDC047279]|uniref:phosphopantetheine-binding protein n=1 Tax=Spirillospora sp. NPDC047279 TaxID=3155478 RepID=UPI0033CA00C2
MSSSTLTAEQVRADVAAMVGCDPAEITPDENLFDLGLDSVRIMTLVERWREAGAPHLEVPDLAERPELAYWTTLVAAT